MFDLIPNAYAQGAPEGAQAAMGNIIFMVLLFAIFYFLLIRPQQKQAKLHKELLENLGRGDSVVTSSGILGRIHKIDDEDVLLEVGQVETANRQFKAVRIKIRKTNIATVTAKSGAPAPEKSDDKDSDEPKSDDK
ncbi:MAG: preprotein translocase subunit YajC [Magnetococcales bacterium]|nr:preprotein translocase subunit YajC [Magnetococcales bacterium]